MTKKNSSEIEHKDFSLTRVFNAPRDVVFKVWTEAEHVKKWWGPKGFTTTFCKVDFCPGGFCHYCMRSSEGRDYWGKGTYLEIDAPKKLVIRDTFSDAQGNLVSPIEYGLNEWPEETQWVVTFDALKEKTRVTIHIGVSEEVAKSQGAEQGWTETLDHLDEYLENFKKDRNG